MPATLTILLAGANPTTRAIRDALRDWSAVHLLHDLVWVWADSAGAAGTMAPADLIAEGELRQAPLQDHLSQLHGETPLRLVVLSSLGGTAGLVPPELAASLRNGLVSNGVLPSTAMHAIVTRHGRGGWQDEANWDQWHNVVLAPEDSSHPGANRARQVFSTDLHRQAGFQGHAAAALAGVTGLWRGMSAGPFDGRQLPGGPTSVVARSHLRRLDADDVTEQLRAGFAELGAGLPRPIANGRYLDYLEDPASAAAGMIEQVAERHPELFQSSRVAEEVLPPIPIRWWRMLLWFFAFVWAALRSAPGDWLESVSDQAASKVARLVHQVTLGSEETRYRVIVRGVGPDGLKDNASGLAEAAESLALSVRQFNREERPLPSLAGFWRDAHAGAFALADGVEHVPGLAGPAVNGRPGVVRNPAHLAPPPDAFTVDPAIATRTVPEVQAHDARTARMLDRALGEIADEQGYDARAASAEQSRLRSWFRRHATSYLVVLGSRIDDRLNQALAELLALIEQLRTSVPDEVEESLRDGARRLARRIRRGFVAVILLITIFVIAAGLDKIPWWVTGVATVLLLALWLLICGAEFVRSAQAEFARSCARRPDDGRSQVLGRNLALAAQEVQLLAIAYAQYLCWATVLGRFVADPLAYRPSDRPPPARLGGPLPLQIRFGRAVPDQESNGRLIDEVRDELLRPGWLGELWELSRERAPGRLGRTGRRLDADDLLSDRVTEVDSPLRLWAELVQREGVDPGPGEQLWRRARASILSRDTSRMTRELFAQVETGSGPTPGRTENGTDFLASLLTSLRHPRAFDTELFTPTGRTHQAGSVAETVVVSDPALLSLAGVQPAGASITRLEPEPGDATALDQFVAVIELSGTLPGQGYLQLADDGGGRAAPGAEPVAPTSAGPVPEPAPDPHTGF